MGTTYKAGDRVEVGGKGGKVSGTVAGPIPVDWSRGVAGCVLVKLDGGAGALWCALSDVSPHSETWPADPVVAPTEPAPADLNCPTCCRPMRERGEVRVHVWACGCVVRPTAVKACNLVAYQTAGGYDRGWCAAGHGVAAEETEHPTEAGAVAAWRTALERRQRKDDERAAEVVSFTWAARPDADAGVDVERAPWTVVDRIAPAPEIATAPRAVPVPGSMFASREWQNRIVDAHRVARHGDAGREVFGYALADSTPDPENPGQHTVTVAISGPARAEMERRHLARERECFATLPDRTDDEVRRVAAACTDRTHVETLVAVANECARRWPSAKWGNERPTFCVEASGAIGGTWAPSGDAWFPTAASVIKVMRRIAGVA